MSQKNARKLTKLYFSYRALKKKHKILTFFRKIIPEIIFRTTKLEGEPVTRKFVSSVLK